MAQKTKDRIAKELYGSDWTFDELNAGEKAAVTRAFNAQSAEAPRTRSVGSSGAMKCEVGRISVNGTKACLVPKGSTLRQLLSQAGYTVDTKKEGVLTHPAGRKVELDDLVKDGEVYMITPNIDSAN